MSRYVTTTLPYVNADPHLGHALEFVEADCYVRALRALGEEVFFNIGTDEHGAKVAKRAEESGKIPKDFVDFYANQFKLFAKRLNISEDTFLRTTDPKHERAAQEMWKRCAATGDIYKADYEIKYCVGCELEKTDSELVDGKCPLHPTLTIEVRKEENYFFRFSKYQDALLAHYEQHPDFVVPKERLNEIVSFVKSGLKDFSISRPSEKLSWGVRVPGDDSHIMYVWFDALTSYLSAIGWPENEETFKKWWPVTHFAGKDNLRQQSAMFQAMLLSAGFPLSRQVFIHGTIISGGQKMSKTTGNVIDPMAIAEKYGVDALRYVLLRHAHPFEDTDLTLENIHEYYTANLVNGLGNLVARVMTLAEQHLSPVSLTPEDMNIEPAFTEKMETFKFNEAMDLVWEHVGKGDAYMTTEEPYKKIKTEPEEAKKVLEKLVKHITKVAAHLAPAMPATSEIILKAVRQNKKPENLFPRL
jgi:methionyl-tRNA synthetase